MTPRVWRGSVGLALALLGTAPAAQQPAEGFASVAPPSAIHAALQANLKIARNWLDQNDLGSTAQTAQALAVLAQLYGHQSADAGWRARTTALRDGCQRLAGAAGRKDAAACATALQDCDRLLADLAKGPPPGEKGKDANFQPFGSNKAWMSLLDWAYADAKSAKTAREVEGLAYLLAEETNAVGHLRPAPQWRQAAHGARDAALLAAKKARADDLPGARAALKKAYESCTACHEGFRRP
jgi:hypothetical protein